MPETVFTIRDTRSANWFWADNKAVDELLPILGATNFSIYITLCRIAGDKSQCNPSVNTLAKRTALSVDTIRRGLRRLLELNVIAISRDNINGLDLSNSYTLLNLGNFKTSMGASTSMGAGTSKQAENSVVTGIAPVLVLANSPQSPLKIRKSESEDKKQSKREETKTPLPPQAGDVVEVTEPSFENFALEAKPEELKTTISAAPKVSAPKAVIANRQGIRRDQPRPPATAAENAIAIVVIQRWLDTHKVGLRIPPTPGDMYFNCVVSRLRDGYTEQDLYDGIQGCYLDDFSMGRSPASTKKWNDLTLICRVNQADNTNKLQYFINIFDESSAPVETPLERQPTPKQANFAPSRSEDVQARVDQQFDVIRQRMFGNAN